MTAPKVAKRVSAPPANDSATGAPRDRASTPKAPKQLPSPIPELYFATVRAIGTPINPVEDQLGKALAEANFALHPIKVSRSFELQVRERFPAPAGESRYFRFMRLSNAAVWFRSITRKKDAVVLAAIEDLHKKQRTSAKAAARRNRRRGVAFLFRNLMHQREVDRLRKLYDRQFFLISVYSPIERRQLSLKNHLGGRKGDDQHAKDLIYREGEWFELEKRYDRRVASDRKYVIDIPRTFQEADLFLDADDKDNPKHVERFVELIFGNPFHTPTRDEIGMADAFAAALQSGNLARRVGAALCADNGDLLGTGTNDVPKPGGGVYRSDDDPDFRDHNDHPSISHARGYESSDRIRRDMLTDLIHRLLADPVWLDRLDDAMQEAGIRPDPLPGRSLAEAVELTVEPSGDFAHNLIRLDGVIDSILESDLIWDAEFFDVLEYGRTMHAEMDAITSAARKGVSLRDSTLYCTTLPCHECARLIVGAGIKRVIFIEPYEKSRVAELYGSEISFPTLEHSRSDAGQSDGMVHFVPYVGVSPRRFSELFSFLPRKLEDQEGERRLLRGDRVLWEQAKSSNPVRESIISDSALHSPRRLQDVLDHEAALVDELHDAIRVGLKELGE